MRGSEEGWASEEVVGSLVSTLHSWDWGKEKKMCREEARREGGLDQERRKWNWREVGGSKEYFGFGIGRT